MCLASKGNAMLVSSPNTLLFPPWESIVLCVTPRPRHPTGRGGATRPASAAALVAASGTTSGGEHTWELTLGTYGPTYGTLRHT